MHHTLKLLALKVQQNERSAKELRGKQVSHGMHTFFTPENQGIAKTCE
jgi:hypothetical protein